MNCFKQIRLTTFVEQPYTQTESTRPFRAALRPNDTPQHGRVALSDSSSKLHIIAILRTQSKPLKIVDVTGQVQVCHDSGAAIALYMRRDYRAVQDGKGRIKKLIEQMPSQPAPYEPTLAHRGSVLRYLRPDRLVMTSVGR